MTNNPNSVFSVGRFAYWPVASMLFLLQIFAGGCDSNRKWEITARSLTKHQLDLQQQLVSKHKLLQTTENLEGQTAEKYKELFQLSNEFAVRNDITVHTFVIPGANDDGSDGHLEIVIQNGKIVDAKFEFYEH